MFQFERACKPDVYLENAGGTLDFSVPWRGPWGCCDKTRTSCSVEIVRPSPAIFSNHARIEPMALVSLGCSVFFAPYPSGQQESGRERQAPAFLGQYRKCIDV